MVRRSQNGGMNVFQIFGNFKEARKGFKRVGSLSLLALAWDPIAIKDARATSEIEETGNKMCEKHFFLFRKLTR